MSDFLGTFAVVTQLLAAIALSWPALRASALLRHLQTLRERDSSGPVVDSLNERLIRSGSLRRVRWSRVDHALLVGGLVTLVLSATAQLSALYL